MQPQLQGDNQRPQAGVLVRVSTARQGERGASVATQREDGIAYCERRGWRVAMIEEDHASGTNFDRAGYRKLADAAKCGEISRLVVFDLSRFGRNTLEALIELRDFDDAGCEIHSVTEGRQEAGVMRTIYLAFAEQKSRDTSLKVLRSSQHRAGTGHYVARPPFGYDLIACPDANCGRGKKLSPNAQGAIITEVAARFDAGQTQTDIQGWLRSKHGLTVRTGWIRALLTNPAYAGDVFYNRRQRGKFKRAVEEVIITRDAHPALIDREIFDRIQSRFQAPRAIARPTTKPYDGLLICGRCGRVMQRCSNGVKYTYYRCDGRSRLKVCDQPQVAYRRVEAALNAEIESWGIVETLNAERQTLVYRFLNLVAPDIERFANSAGDVRRRLQAELEKLTRQQGMIYEDRLEGRITAEFAAKKLDEIEERINAATAELATVKTTATPADWYRACLGAVSDLPHTEQELLMLLVDRIGNHTARELFRLLVTRIVVSGDALAVEWTDYAHSLVNNADGSPSRRPKAGTLTLCSR